jgi:hypothetical protein
VFKIVCGNNAALNKFRPKIGTSWAKVLNDFIAAGEEFFPILNGKPDTKPGEGFFGGEPIDIPVLQPPSRAPQLAFELD